jgi:hypothetical protein
MGVEGSVVGVVWCWDFLVAWQWMVVVKFGSAAVGLRGLDYF